MMHMEHDDGAFSGVIFKYCRSQVVAVGTQWGTYLDLYILDILHL